MADAPDSADASPPLINADDFRSLQIEIALENVTTRTVLKNGKRFLGDREDKDAAGQDLSLRLVEIIPTGSIPQFAIEAPHRNCAVGHHLQLSFQVKGPQGLQFKIEVPARVRAVETVDTGRDRITVGLFEANNASWESLLAAFASRQTASDELFERMKGRE